MTRFVLALVVLTLVVAPPGVAQQQPPAADPVAELLFRLEQAIRSGAPGRYLDLLSANADRQSCATFAENTIFPGITRVVVRERDRFDLVGTLPGEGYRLLIEVFVEYGPRARVTTWRLDVKQRVGDWGIVSQDVLTTLSGLYRLSLNPKRQIAVKDLVVRAEDLTVTMPDATMLVAESEIGPTAVVVLGRGEMTFSPAPETERSQLRLLTGQDTLQLPVENVFFRINPAEFDAHVTAREMAERPSVDPRDLRRAEEIFRQDVTKSFGLDLVDFTSETWSLLPAAGDFLAEFRTTKRFESLTYARSGGEIEDISVFDRKSRHNLSVYSSREHLARYTRFYSEDQKAEYVVRSTDVETTYSPVRQWLEGRANLVIETTVGSVNSLTLKLAEPLVVQAAVTAELGRVMCVRVRGQNSVVLNLPATVLKGFRLHLTVAYAGRMEPQEIDRESIAVASQNRQPEDEFDIPLEETYLFSNRSFWYPQSPTLNYAPAEIRVNVDEPWTVLASGTPVSVTPRPGVVSPVPQRQFTFSAAQPVKYLAILIGRFAEARHESISLQDMGETGRIVRGAGTFYDQADLRVFTSPRQKGRGREIAKTAVGVMKFYSTLVGDCPYSSVTVAGIEKKLPGGHSPAYLAVVATPGPSASHRWADDPAALPDFPDFFIAHELAHQWWGQAVGWKNYHEQWLSEGFAQYFSALYAEQARGRNTFDAIIRKLQDWAVNESDQGPIYLGYRIGHVKGDSRLFRAVVYNKGAMVLHMLRRLVGDQAFFSGLRRFYAEWRFKKAGTDDLRRAMEQESGRDLGRYFDQWVLGEGVPRVSGSWRLVQGAAAGAGTGAQGGAPEVEIRLEQAGEVFDVPVTVSLEYQDDRTQTVVAKLTERTTDMRIPLTGRLRKIELNRDQAAVGIFTVKQQ
jgi:hypothetical protein